MCIPPPPPTTRSSWNPSRRPCALLASSARSSAAARWRTRPRTSSAIPPLVEERADGRSAFLQPRRLGREKILWRRAARWPHDTLAHKTRQAAVIIGTECGDGLEPRDGPSAVDDQHRRTALHAVDQRAEIVLGFSDTGLLHNGQNA